jgi:hypothetical protein
MFFQEFIPDTSRYMNLGFAVSFIVMALYVISLYIRNRNLKQDLAILEEMDRAAAETASPPAKQKRKSQAPSAGKKAGK